jgi:hypothetical protein
MTAAKEKMSSGYFDRCPASPQTVGKLYVVSERENWFAEFSQDGF